MKSNSKLCLMPLGIGLMLLFSSVQIQAQFSQLYGNSSNNFFNRLIPDGQDFYVLGRDEGKATVSRINSAGVLSWTRVLDMPSRLTDGMVVAGSGNMIVVGATLPVDSSNHSILGEITRQGVFTCLKTLDVMGPEALTRMDSNVDGTFSIVGTQTLPGFTQDVFVLNVSPGCLINSKKVVASPGVDNFANDIKVLCNGNFLVAGDQDGRAVMFEFSLTGQYVTGSQNPFNYAYNDIVNTSNCDILVVANSLVSAPPIIKRFDANWLPLWEASVVGLQTLNKVIEDGNGNILVTGRALIGGITRTVIIKIDDSNGPLTLSWGGARYLDNNESSFVAGSIALPVSGGIAIIDGRDGNPNGFGMHDAFMVYTDDDLTSDCTRDLGLDVVIESTLFEGPIIEIFNYDVPPETMVTYSSVDWEQREACGANPNPDTCVCVTPQITLFQNGVEYPLSCLPHGGSTPVVGCPTGTVSIGGFFGCVDPNTGEPCSTGTAVTYVLTGPNGGTPIDGGTTTNYTQFLFPPSYFQANGTYKLTLSTLCPGQQDSCVCILDWIVECDSCCQDSLAFLTAAQNVQNSGQLGDLCDISFTTDGLTDCSETTFFWGDGQSTGPILGGSASVSHSYTSGGMYNVCYTVYEVNNIDTCWSYTHCNSVQIVCDTCFCAIPSFSNLYLRGPGGPSIPIQCETSYENIGCPDPGKGFTLTGLFECAGDSCDTKPYVYWDLIGPSGGSAASGSSPGPYFGVNLWPAYFAQPGIYTMKLSGFCNFDTCICEFQFIVDCPAQCPCDINDLQADVNQGFNHVLLPRQCQACFTPTALSECDSVYWYITNTNGAFIGSSVGNHSFCYTFSGSGTYSIFMQVTRKKPDGSNCETFTIVQTVRISCGISPLCDNSAFSNPTFSESAVAGGFYSGGSSFGWYGLLGEPVVTVGVEGSSDGWTIQLWGNLDTSAVLTHLNAICLERDTGTITLRTEEPKKKKPPFVGPDPKNENLKFHIFQGDIFDPDNCNGIDCYELASIPISALPLDEWYEVQIPYDLRGKMAMDTCTGGQGVLVRPAIFVSNIFGSNQGGSETYSSVHIDDLCFNGTIVAVNDPGQESGIRIFPNPTTGVLNIQMQIIQQSDVSLQVISLTGQPLLEKRAETGITVQTMDASLLPQGMYFLQILSKGQVIAVNKFVKQ